MNITYSECVFVDLGIQHEMRMIHIVICILSGSTEFFHIISQKARISKKIIENKMCFDFLYNLSETFLILRWTEWDMIKNVCWVSCKVTVILVKL
jgi:hypothetical protein